MTYSLALEDLDIDLLMSGPPCQLLSVKGINYSEN